MACFSAPAALGVLTYVFRSKFPKQLHVDWLYTMCLGGTAALAVEHVVHEEIVPWPPFLTAMASPADMMEMLWEIATVGGAMSVALVFVWVLMVVLYEKVVLPRASAAKTRA